MTDSFGKSGDVVQFSFGYVNTEMVCVYGWVYLLYMYIHKLTGVHVYQTVILCICASLRTYPISSHILPQEMSRHRCLPFHSNEKQFSNVDFLLFGSNKMSTTCTSFALLQCLLMSLFRMCFVNTLSFLS